MTANEQFDDQTTRVGGAVSGEAARQGRTEGVVRYVLAISLTLAFVAMIAAFLIS